MFFEARIHEIIIMDDAFAAAQWIRSAKMQDHHAVRWLSEDRKSYLYAVPDGHLDEIQAELAILRQPIDSKNMMCEQIENLTNKWISRTSHLKKLLRRIESESVMTRNNVKLIIGKPDGTDEVYFTCSCCNNSFLGNVARQLSFDQDAGYGLCEKCQERYGV